MVGHHSALDNRWLNPVIVCQMAIFVEFFGFGEQITILPFFLDQIGAPRVGLGLVLAAQQGGIVIGSTLLGWFSDKYGRKKAVVLALVANCLFSAVGAVCQTQASLMAIRFVTGLFTITTPSLSWLLAAVDHEGKSQAIARWISGLLLGIGLGSVIGGYVGHNWGWPAAMFLVAAQSLFVTILCCYTDESLHEPTVVHDDTGKLEEFSPLLASSSRDMALSPYYMILVLASFADGMSILSLHSTLAALLMEDYGWNEDAIGAMNGVYSLVCILTTWFLFRPVVDFLGAFRASLYGIFWKGFAIALVGVMADRQWRLYCGACLFFGLVYNLANPALVALISDMCQTFEPERMGTLIGVFRSANSVGSTVGPALAVHLLGVSRMLPFLVLAGMQILLFALVALMKAVDSTNWFLDTTKPL